MLKKTLSLVLSVILLVGVLVTAPSASAKDSGDSAPVFGIDKTYLCAGDQLRVSNPDSYTLKYFVGEEEVVGEGLTLLTDHYESWITVKAYSGDELAAEDRVYFSKLPVLYINTEGGQAITSKEEYLSGDMFIQNNTETDAAMYSGALKIKGRGNTTWNWPKKPYRLKLDKKTDLFGMGKNKNWVLLANYLDECMLRNTTGFQVAEQLGLTTMQCVWTDVILNGEYVGNYQLCEQIRIDDTRVDIFDWESEAGDLASAVSKAEKNKGNKIDKDALEDLLKEDLSWVTEGRFTFNGVEYIVSDYYDAEDDITGGYLFELSNEYDEQSKFTTGAGLKVMLKSPEFLNSNQDMMDYVEQYWQDFEDAYRSDDGYVDTADGPKHYTELADFDSMVAYWLVMEIVGNNDAIYKSRYAYKDIGDVLRFGPVWDFDWGVASYMVGNVSGAWKLTYTDSVRSTQNFFKEFLDDPLFLSRATELYWSIRPFLESLIEKNGIIDTELEYLRESAEADQARWDRKDTWEKARGFTKDASTMKTYLQRRFLWLDKQFASVDALLESTRTELSASPYVKAADALAIKLPNAAGDVYTQHAPADGVIRKGMNAVVNLTVSDGDTASVKVYVNGLYYKDMRAGLNSVEFAVPQELLTAEEGCKNVISLIGKNAEGETTVRNYTTVIIREPDEDIICGDADDNGQITIMDATCMQRYLADLSVNSFCYDAANLSGSVLTIMEATYIQRYLAEFTVPYDIGGII